MFGFRQILHFECFLRRWRVSVLILSRTYSLSDQLSSRRRSAPLLIPRLSARSPFGSISSFAPARGHSPYRRYLLTRHSRLGIEDGRPQHLPRMSKLAFDRTIPPLSPPIDTLSRRVLSTSPAPPLSIFLSRTPRQTPTGRCHKLSASCLDSSSTPRPLLPTLRRCPLRTSQESLTKSKRPRSLTGSPYFEDAGNRDRASRESKFRRTRCGWIPRRTRLFLGTRRPSDSNSSVSRTAALSRTISDQSRKIQPMHLQFREGGTERSRLRTHLPIDPFSTLSFPSQRAQTTSGFLIASLR